MNGATTRRALIAGAALPIIAAVPAFAAQPDAELLALGKKLDVLLSQHRALGQLHNRLCEQRDEIFRREGLRFGYADLERRIQIEDEIGFSAANDEDCRLTDEIGKLMKDANAHAATTIAGVQVKAMLALYFVPTDEDWWGAPAIKSALEDILAMGRA